MPQWMWDGWQESDCFCTTQYEPICATDLRRYWNICTFECRIDFLKQNNLQNIKAVNCTGNFPPSVKN